VLLCAAIDQAGWVERLADELRGSRQDDTRWARRRAGAGEMWHIRFRELARTPIDFLAKSPQAD